MKTNNTHNLGGIRFLSFDIWGTLLRGHPDFRAARQEIIAQALGLHDLVQFAQVASAVDDDLDTRADATGEDFNFTDRVREIAGRSGKDTTRLDLDFFTKLQAQVNAKYHLLPPSWIEPDILDTLVYLKAEGYTLGLLSNTGFINGVAQRVALATLGGLDLFAVALFSDEVGVAKPHHDIYELLLANSGVNRGEILHIGDNVRADYRGAESFGITPVLYDPTQKNTEDVRMITTMRALPDLLAR